MWSAIAHYEYSSTSEPVPTAGHPAANRGFLSVRHEHKVRVTPHHMLGELLPPPLEILADAWHELECHSARVLKIVHCMRPERRYKQHIACTLDACEELCARFTPTNLRHGVLKHAGNRLAAVDRVLRRKH